MDSDKCPVARTVALIGDRWTILILRDLLLRGPHKFQDLQRSLGKVGSTTLSSRLKALEANGLIERRMYSDYPPRAEYLLTEKGQSLGPIVAALRDWGQANFET